MRLDFLILGYAAPILTAIALAVIMTADRRTRSLATLYLAATVTMGFGEMFASRIGYQVIELVIVGVFLSRLRDLRIVRNPAVLSVLAFLVLALISLAFATLRGGVSDPIVGSVINVLASCLGAAFLLSDVRLSANHGSVLKVTAIPIVLVALTGIYEAFVHPGVRVSGIYANVNPFAYMMAVGFMLTMHFYRGPVRLVFAVVLAAALFFTESRAAFLMVGAYCLLRIWWLFRKGAVVPLLATAMVAAVVIGVGAASILGRYAEGGSTYSRTVDAERQMIYRSASDAIATHPATGIGWGQFKHQFTHYGAYRLSTDSFDIGNHSSLFGRRKVLMTHNDFLSMPTELGIPFSLIFLALFLMSGRYALRGGTPLRELVLPLFMGNVIYSLSHNSSNSAIFFYLLFLPVAYAQLSAQPKLVTRRNRAFRISFAPARREA